MKKILLLTLAGLALLGTPPARGGTTYQDGDVLLIFRQPGLNDVEYDLGNISQFTNHPVGYATAVTGWDPTVATGVFGTDLTGVSVILASTRSLTNANRASWLSSGDPTAVISDVTPTTWQGNLWSVINAIGNLGGWLGPSVYGIIKDATGSTDLSLLCMAIGPLLTALCIVLAGHDRRSERMMAR